jgi:predicted nucleotidyltransferase
METLIVITKETIRQKREDIRRIAAQPGAVNLRVFGSVARDESRQNSDLDLLMDVGPTTSSWFPAGLIPDLEKLLGCRVDYLGIDLDIIWEISRRDIPELKRVISTILEERS